MRTLSGFFYVWSMVMKRDMDLIREVLLAIESKDGSFDAINLEIEHYDSKQISYHIHILSQAGFVESKSICTQGNEYNCLVYNLTFAGHEYLDSMRSPIIWLRGKHISKKTGAGLNVETFRALSAQAIKEYLEQRK